MARVTVLEKGKHEYKIHNNDYKNFNYAVYNACKGVDNTVQVETKKGSMQTLSDVINKNGSENVVIYTITNDYLADEHYISDGNMLVNGTVQPVLNDKLINPSPDALKRNIIDSIKSSILLNDVYQYRWVSNRIICTDMDNNIIDIDSIGNDDFYVIKLLELIMKKGLHKGVLILDTLALNEVVCNKLKTVVKLLCKEHVVLLIE